VSHSLKVSVGEYSDKGRKDINQDFHGTLCPVEPLLSSKGVAVALADGISSSTVSQEASKAAVTAFLADYFCTSEAWTVKTSAQRVLMASNSWLCSQTQQSEFRYDKNKGYVCTLSAMVIKARTAHIFHVGDARVYHLNESTLEQLTHDHRLWVSEETSHLARALGVNDVLEIDYQAMAVKVGDTFFLATDGVYEFVDATFVLQIINENAANLDLAAKLIVEQAYANGSDDNLTAQIVRVDELPSENESGLQHSLSELPLPPILEARQVFDGYTILREVHASSRSHVYLAVDNETNIKHIIKTPSIDLADDKAYLERFLMEEWIARRLNSPYVLKPSVQIRQRHFLYTVTEYIDGQTLTQWMLDNPKPSVQCVRGIVEQIAKGLQSFHRQEMLHQDLRPENIMIDHSGTVKIIDFGSTRVAGVVEMEGVDVQEILGTVQYTAPEYFLGELGSANSDLFSLAVICYQMLTGRLPYGVDVPKSRTKASQRKLRYKSALHDDREIPVWIDDVLKKALHINPFKRYQELSEFVFDLRQPTKTFLNKARPPLVERDPVLFWKSTSFILAFILIVLLTK